MEPIAIIGIGCRFPGGIKDPVSFWQALIHGVDAITEIPPDRFDINTYYKSEPQTPGKMATRFGGFIDDIDKFDAEFFGIAPIEAARMDPQQRVLMEVAWEAFEDSGIVPGQLSGTSTGVFVGSWLQDFESRLVGDPSVDDIRAVDLYTTTGSGRYSLSSRLSYFFGLQGPSIVVDTHCSSSLVAVHLGCQSIWQKESEIAIAGGVNVILTPYITVAYSQSGMIAQDGRCKFGDAKANGYVRSEGCGLVVLKPLSSAVADGNNVYAVILGSAVNNDGRSSGFLTTPGRAGQEEVLRKAYVRAGISPGRVAYIEAHGTGTPTGDPVELSALADVLVENRPKGEDCLVGSVKTNLGHTEGAAGVAGLIKVALALKHQEIPPNLNFHEPNPHIPWDAIPIKIPVERTPWSYCGNPRVGGVSSFGITGTNSHIVLQEYSSIRATEAEADKMSPYQASRKYLFPVSASSPEALSDKISALIGLLKGSDRYAEASFFEEFCATAALMRDHLGYRVALVVENAKQLQEGLWGLLDGHNPAGLFYRPEIINDRRKIVFVFPGQGSQYHGMCQNLMAQSTVFRESIERCDRVLRPYVDWSLLEQLSAGSSSIRNDDIDVVQPVLFAIQIALAEQWRAWGVEPDAVIGHSMGEAAAACVCGALRLDEAARVITKRSLLMKRKSGQGAMALVDLTFDQAMEVIAGREREISIAVCNSPMSTVLSGDPRSLDEVLNGLENRDIFFRKIKVDVASHSPQMDSIRLELVEALRELDPKPGTIPIYSTVTGYVRDGRELDACYWGENLRRPVQFSAAVTKLLESQHSVFIEMSPHPLLLRAVDETCEVQDKGSGFPCLALPSLLREEDDMASLLKSVGRIYVSGYPIRWQCLYRKPKSTIKLPSYPWQRKRYWFDETSKRQGQLKLSVGMSQCGDVNSRTEETPILPEKSSEASATRSLRESLTAAEPGKARALILETYLKEQLAKLLMLPASLLDTCKSFKAYGMDSLTALKYRNRIESATGLKLSATLVWNYPNIKRLSGFLAETMGMSLDRSRAECVAANSEPMVKQEAIGTEGVTVGELLEELESMSDEEALKLLNDERQ